MSLFERAQNLSLEIQEIDALKKRADQAELFEKRATALSVPADEMKKLEPAITIIANLDIPVLSLDHNLIDNLNRRIVDLRDRYTFDKNVMLDPFPEEDVRWVFNQPLTQLPQKVKTALLEAWENWAKKNIPEIDGDVLDILGGIVTLRESVIAVRSLKASAETICTSLPNGDDVDQLKKLCEKISDAWHNLTGEGIPNDVLVFLRTAGSRDGARFDLLTTEVLDWLTIHGLRDSLRIKMG